MAEKKSKKQSKSVESAILRMTPRIHLNEDMLPEVKDWEVGENYKIELSVKQVGKHMDDEFGMGADFEIKSAKDVT